MHLHHTCHPAGITKKNPELPALPYKAERGALWLEFINKEPQQRLLSNRVSKKSNIFGLYLEAISQLHEFPN